MGTEVFLNIYDLTPANDFLYNAGLGLHHSGVEIMGTEYSFASGAGIFNAPPKEAPGAIFRESIRMGTFEGGSAEVRTAVSELRDDFGPDAYNLVLKNCNHFASAICWELLGKAIPGYVNRLADLGGCCKCLIPQQMLESAPVGHEGGGGSTTSDSGFHVHRSASSSSGNSRLPPPQAFSGHGSTLGGATSSSAAGGGENAGFAGKFAGAVGGALKMRTAAKGPTTGDDLVDRRERARKAALARLEQNNDGNAPDNTGGLKTS